MSGSVTVEIAHRDRMVDYELLEPDDKRIAKGKSNEFTGGVELLYQGTEIRKSVGGPPDISHYILQAGGDIAIGLASAWLYDKLKDKDVVSLMIGGENVDVEEDAIKAKLEEYWEDQEV